ncbi:MAG: galactose mutarotase [Sphaerochaetaceae bacterium]|nr:galactose mutarotase [Sphaerochaetaceae bacterium]
MSTIKITKRPYGIRKDGKQVTEYILDNGKISFSVMDHGAIILSINVPDKDGKVGNVCLGFDNIGQYEEFPKHNFGSFVGRVANRISNHAFELDGQRYELDDNNNSCCLHGGFDRYNHKFYDTEVGSDYVTFSRISPDGEQGFPGNLKVSVRYRLTEDSGLEIYYEATTDKATPINLTNHVFFDLSAGRDSDITKQLLWMENATKYLAVDEVMIPKSVEEVKGTRYDFVSDYKEFGFDGGFDNAYIFDKKPGIVRVGIAKDKISGRTMEIYTDQVSAQVYTGQNNKFPQHGPYSGFCFETQGYVNAINDNRFPSCVLRPGDKYTHTVIYKFI